MKKVFLTNPPLNMAETPLQYHRPLVPLGLAYLGAMLEETYSDGAWSRFVTRRLAGKSRGPYQPCGIVAAQDNMRLSFYGQYRYEQLRDRIAQHAEGADELFIGVSILSDGMPAARRMLRRFRMDFPNAKLLVGGPHATFYPHDFYMDNAARLGPLADYVVRNEGELAILAIVDGLFDDADAVRQNGPAFGVDPTKCEFTEGYRVIDAGQYGASLVGYGAHVLDTLPPPAYFLFEDEAGQLPYEPDTRYGLEAPAANINSSRGCPHKCTFCTIPSLVPGYRTLSPAKMIELIRFLEAEYGVKSIFFREDNYLYEGGVIGGDRWRDIEAFCRELAAKPGKVRWAIEARADNLLQPTTTGESRLELMAKAGLTGIYVGVESGSDAMLKLYVKGSSVQLMSDAMRACRDVGVAVVATACYGDPDILIRKNYALIDWESDTYQYGLMEQREQILRETRALMDKHEIPAERREEYALAGIPVSTVYRLLDRERCNFPALVEHLDPVTRYIYPKGFRWWADAVYDLKRRVRPYVSYLYQPPET